MNKELQDHVWPILPKEFKEEVKDDYKELVSALDYFQNKISLNNEECDRCDLIREKRAIYNKYFGHHNLTSDAEGEEVLIVLRSQIQKWYACVKKINDPSSKDYINGVLNTLDALYGSKCLPDEEPKPTEDDDIKVPEPKCKHYKDGKCAHPAVSHLENGKLVKGAECDVSSCEDVEYEPKPAEPKFKRGDKVRYVGDMQPTYKGKAFVMDGEVFFNDYYNQWQTRSIKPFAWDGLSVCNVPLSDLKPYVEPSEEDSENAQPKSVGSFHLADEETHLRNYSRDCNRLQIAAMAMQGMLGNAEITSFGNLQDAIHREYIVEYALHYADALIAKCGKGGLQ